MGQTRSKLHAFTFVVMVAVSTLVLAGTGGAATAGNASVTLSVPVNADSGNVQVDDSDLNTDPSVAEDHVVNIVSDREGPQTTKQTSADTPDGGTQTVTISPGAKVADRNNDDTIDKNDFTLVGGWPDESITDVSLVNNDYVVTISDAGGSTSDTNTEYVRYDSLKSVQTPADTDNGSPQTVTTATAVGDTNGDGEITAADIKLVTSSDDETVTSVSRNADGTADVEITDSSADGDDNQEKFRYLPAETLLLTETGVDTGVFTGGIPFHSTQTPTNGELLVMHTDTVETTYWDGGSTAITKSTTYKVVESSPTATPSQPDVDGSVTLDGTSSSGSITSYNWDTDGDGNYDDKSGSSATVSFSSAGVYPIGLAVADGSGNSDTATTTVVVGDSGPPTAKLDVYPRYVTKNEQAYLVADSSSDDLSNGIKKYEWDIGADGNYEYSSTQGAFTTHTFSSTGDTDVRLRVTDYAGNTDTVTNTVTVQEKASVSSTSVEHTGNGTAPTGTVSVATRNEGGMLKLHLYRGASTSNRDIGAAGVDESTEFWVNITMTNYEPNAMMASAKVDSWSTSPNADGSGTNISIKMHPINMQRLTTVSAKTPGRWPSQNKQADKSITPGAHLATFDMPDGTDFETDFDGATLSSDAQVFSPPRWDSQTKQLTYSVAAPHWNASGSKVSSNTNVGFYEAVIPSGLVDEMGIQDPESLAGNYQSSGKTSHLSDMTVEKTAGGGLHVEVTGIHYSSGNVILEPDTTLPTADAGGDISVGRATTFDLDGTNSTDNRELVKYEWDIDDDGTYELTGASPSHSYSSIGTNTVTLRVTDGNSNTDTDTLTVTVSDNTAPTADASNSPTSMREGTSQTFDASASSDNIGVTKYEWDFDGDGTYEKTGETTTHSFSSPGDQTVTLRVTDGGSNTDTDSITVSVTEFTHKSSDEVPDLTADPSTSPTAGQEGTAIQFDASASSGDLNISSYEWDVDGDGNYEATGLRPSHTYDDPGTYDVRLLVIDSEGNTDFASLSVTISEKSDVTLPTAEAGPDVTVNTGESVSFDGTASTDNVGVTGYEWDVDGDGDYEASGATVTHTYVTSGARTVTLRVKDGANNTATDTVTVDVQAESTTPDGSDETPPGTPDSDNETVSTPDGEDADTKTPDGENEESDSATKTAGTGTEAAGGNASSSGTPTQTGESGPGFGIVSVLAALAVATLALRRVA